RAKEAAWTSELRAAEQKLLAALVENKQIPAADVPLVKRGEASDQVFLPDSRKEGQSWSYTTAMPSGDWMQPDFGATDWKTGPGGFGTKGTPGAVVRTEWSTADIWLRMKFSVGVLPESLALNLYHDEDVQVYLNGEKVYDAKGFITDYETVSLDAKALKAL